MGFKITKDKLIKIADRYNLDIKKVDNPDDAGIKIDNKVLNEEELFEIIFGCDED